MWLCVNTRSEGCTVVKDISIVLLLPCYIRFDCQRKKEIMLIQFKTIILIRCKTSSKQEYEPTSGEEILWSFPLHDGEKTTFLQWGSSTCQHIIIKIKQLRKHAKHGTKSIQTPLDRCSVANLIVSEHATYSGCCKITFQSWLISDLFSDFRTFRRYFQNMNEIVSFVFDASF